MSGHGNRGAVNEASQMTAGSGGGAAQGSWQGAVLSRPGLAAGPRSVRARQCASGPGTDSVTGPLGWQARYWLRTLPPGHRERKKDGNHLYRENDTGGPGGDLRIRTLIDEAEDAGYWLHVRLH